MIFFPGPMRKLASAAIVFFFCAGARAADPGAEEILSSARMNPLGEKIALNAQLRADSTRVPFQIIVDGDGTIRYVFQNPDQELILALPEEGSELSEKAGGKTATVKPERYGDDVRGSTITYEDLALKFLYWKNPKLIGSEKILGRNAWKIEVQAPRGGESQYGVARLWIDKDTGALTQIEGYDMKGRLIRKFLVRSVQPLGDRWMLKQMRIERLDPETKKNAGRTYLEVLGKTGE